MYYTNESISVLFSSCDFDLFLEKKRKTLQRRIWYHLCNKTLTENDAITGICLLPDVCFYVIVAVGDYTDGLELSPGKYLSNLVNMFHVITTIRTAFV